MARLPADPVEALVRMAQNGMHASLARDLERQVRLIVQKIIERDRQAGG
jgi:hypothetical protein